jgi:hypothetical protein
LLKRASELTRRLSEDNALNKYDTACMQARSATLIGAEKPQPSDEDRALRRRYADRAVESLRKAIAGGSATRPRSSPRMISMRSARARTSRRYSGG